MNALPVVFLSIPLFAGCGAQSTNESKIDNIVTLESSRLIRVQKKREHDRVYLKFSLCVDGSSQCQPITPKWLDSESLRQQASLSTHLRRSIDSL